MGMETDDKIAGLEGSIKVMAEYLKKEVTDFRKQAASIADLDGLKSDMENEIHSVSMGIMEKLGALEARLEEIRSGPRDSEKDAKISRLERRLEEMSALDSKLADVGSDLSNLKSAIGNAALAQEGTEASKAHMARLEKMENDIKDIQGIPKAVPSLDPAKLRQVSERTSMMSNELRSLRNETDEIRMQLDSVSKFEGRFKPVYEDMAKLKKQIEEMPKTVSHTDREILDELEGIRRQLDSVQRADSKFKAVYDEMSRLRNRMEDISKALAAANKEMLYDVDELKARADDTSKTDAKFKAVYDEMSKLRNRMDEMPRTLGNADREIIDELERIKKQLDDIPAATGSKIKRIYGELGEIRKYVEEAPAITGNRIKYIDSELSEIKKQLGEMPADRTGKVRQAYDEISRLKKRVEDMQGMESDIKYMRGELGDIKKRLAEPQAGRANDVREGLDKLRQAMDEELAYRMSTDKKLADIENRLSRKAAEAQPGTDAVTAHEELLDEISDVRRMVDEEAAQRISLDKKMLDIEGRIASAPGNRTDIDYRKLSEMLKSDKAIEEAIEKKFEESSLRLVTERINDFARLMDKRVPEIATKDDLAKLEDRLSAKPKPPPANRDRDVSERIARLEENINRMVASLNAMKHSKNSFVVE